MESSDAQAFTPVVGTVEQGRAWIGRRRTRGTSAPVAATQSLQFAAALEDGDDRWWERGEMPPALLMSLGMPLPWTPRGSRAPLQVIVFDIPLPGESLIGSTLESELHHPVRLGDRITVTEEIVAVSDEKLTALGPGHFVTWRWTYVNQDGVRCAVDTVESLRFRSDMGNSAT